MDKRFQTLSLVAGVFVTTVIIFMVVGGIQDSQPSQKPDELVVFILAAVGVSNLFLGPVVGKVAAKNKQRTGGDEAEAFFIKHLMRLVFQETAAIFGLFLTILTGDKTWVLGMGTLTLICYFIAWPKKSHLSLTPSIPNVPRSQ